MIDPFTGLDLAAYEQTEYQIPLASNPMLAPEWDPKGRYTDVLHPDNIPTMFGTLQAYNNESPKNVQALSTDGKRNLNVNIAAGGGGGSPVPLFGGPAIQAYSNLFGDPWAIHGIGNQHSSPIFTYDPTIYRYFCGFSAAWYIDPAHSVTPGTVLWAFELSTDVNGVFWRTFGALASGYGGGGAQSENQVVFFPFPIDMETYAVPTEIRWRVIVVDGTLGVKGDIALHFTGAST